MGTIGVYEPPARNSGFMGGKFMEFRKHRFVLIEADEYTLNYMENKKFPSSDVSTIVDKLKEKLSEQNALIRDTFRRFDSDHSGALNMAEFRDVLKKFNFTVTDQELITIMRKFDPNGDGAIRYDEFCATVLEDDYKAVESSSGGQVLHGENAHTVAANAEKEKEEEDKAQAARQERLNELLGAFREQLFPYRDQIQQMFAEFDENGTGHCDMDKFKQLLEQMGIEVEELDMELLMESFYDPDVEDQTRPMSIAVLDEALFG